MTSPDPLINWFTSNGGTFDHTSLEFRELGGTGRSAIALKDIDEGHTLFAIPRSLLLSTRTCLLKTHLSEEEWESLGTGWASLILCMMWEQSKGSESVWAGYLECLPTTYTTPMFWSEEDIAELKGTAIIDKIGKEEAEKDYQTRVVPLISSRQDLFPPQYHDTIFSLENFHRLGSAILSRSFHVEEWKGGNTGNMEDDSDLSDSEEEREDTADVSMVPMADMLNARFECDNARLFYERTTVSMITTKPIKAPQQIWNTYGDPPNSDLLRRYGHVDYVLLPDEPGVYGNPADVVEINADIAVQVCTEEGVLTSASTSTSAGGVVSAESVKERIDWWLEEGGDDVFVIEASVPAPPEGLISLIKLFALSSEDYTKAKTKSRPPKPKIDSRQVVDIAIKVLERRLREYPTTFEEDEALLEYPRDLTLNRRKAVVVRIGEKRILKNVLVSLRNTATELPASPPGEVAGSPASSAQTQTETSNLKRGRTSDGAGSSKKSRR